MQEIIIGKNEAGQRLDKFLAKYMNLAPKSFPTFISDMTVPDQPVLSKAESAEERQDS